MLSEHARDWQQATEEQRASYLLEEHENAHHMLLYSSPVGVLLWRLVQVVHRDIAHFSMAKNQLQVEIPQNRTPHHFFKSGDFFKYLIETRGGQLSDFAYPQGIIDAIDKIFLLIDILFHHNPSEEFSDLTVGELIDLLNDVFQWLVERCDIPPCGKWVSGLPRTEKVFAPGRDWSCMALAEVHACARELYLLRSFGDIAHFQERAKEFSGDVFGNCFDVIREATRYDNEVGFSPHEMQMSVLYALSGKIDPTMAAGQDLVFEHEFPNFRVGKERNRHFELLRSSVENLSNLAQTPLVGAGSKWLSMHSRGTATSLASVTDFFSTMMSLGLDRQIYSIKNGVAANAQFISSKVLHSSGQMPNDRWEEEWEKWNRDLKLSQIMCEYSDDFYFSYADPNEIYPAGHPVWELDGISVFFTPPLQFASSILVGFLQQMHIASYFHYPVSTIDVIEPKIERFMKREFAELSTGLDPVEFSKLLNGTMRRYYETVQAPFGVTHIRANPMRSHLI